MPEQTQGHYGERQTRPSTTAHALSRAGMLYLASVSFRFVSPSVSFYSIRSVPYHFVSVNAASYGDLRNAQRSPSSSPIY